MSRDVRETALPRNHKKAWFIGISLAIIIVAFLWTMGAMASDIPVTTLNDVFVDVNGDGLPDFVRYAEVVINNGNPTPNP